MTTTMAQKIYVNGRLTTVEEFVADSHKPGNFQLTDHHKAILQMLKPGDTKNLAYRSGRMFFIYAIAEHQPPVPMSRLGNPITSVSGSFTVAARIHGREGRLGIEDGSAHKRGKSFIKWIDTQGKSWETDQVHWNGYDPHTIIDPLAIPPFKQITKKPDMEDQKALYVSIRNAARMLDCSGRTVRNLAAQGRLTKLYFGTLIRFSVQEIEDLKRTYAPRKLRSKDTPG